MFIKFFIETWANASYFVGGFIALVMVIASIRGNGMVKASRGAQGPGWPAMLIYTAITAAVAWFCYTVTIEGKENVLVVAGILVVFFLSMGSHYASLRRQFAREDERARAKAENEERRRQQQEARKQDEQNKLVPTVDATSPEILFPNTIDGMVPRYTYTNVGVFAIDLVKAGRLEKFQLLQVGRDSHNQHDDHNVALFNKDGDVVGYLYKNTKQYQMADDYMTRGWPMLAQVTDFHLASQQYNVTLRFYGPEKQEEEKPSTVKAKGFKLARTGGEEAQDNIGMLEVGTPLSISLDMDSEQDRYLVEDGNLYVGTLPIAAVKVMDGLGGPDCCRAMVADISEDENGKYQVRVTIDKYA